MDRYTFIERLIRQVYNGQPTDDASMTFELVNKYLIDATAMAVKQHYAENLKLDNVAYINNAFYSTFTQLPIIRDRSLGLFCYKIELPSIPPALGRNEGINSLRISDGVNISFDAIPLNASQITYASNLRPIPKRIMYWNENKNVYINTEIDLTGMTGIVRMISGGDANDLDSELSIPAEWFPFINDYVLKQLLVEHSQAKDNTNDGNDQV